MNESYTAAQLRDLCHAALSRRASQHVNVRDMQVRAGGSIDFSYQPQPQGFTHRLNLSTALEVLEYTASDAAEPTDLALTVEHLVHLVADPAWYTGMRASFPLPLPGLGFFRKRLHRQSHDSQATHARL